MLKWVVWCVLFVAVQARAHDVLVVAFDSSTMPTMYAGPKGEAQGIYPAIVRAAFERMGVPVRTVAVPFQRGVRALYRGDMAVGSLLPTPERERFARFSRPYFIERVSVFARRGGDYRFESMRDLHGRRVGVLRGWSYGEAFDRDRAARKFEAAEVDTDDRNFMKLGMGRLDFAVATTLSGELLALRPEFARIATSPRDLVAAPIHLAINQRSPHVGLIRRFDKAIAEMRASGEIDAIVAAEMARARQARAGRQR